MDREAFLEVLRKQYADEIYEAYLECEHEDGKINFVELNNALRKLMNSAKSEGLLAKDFEDLVKSTLPEVIDNLEVFSNRAA